MQTNVLALVAVLLSSVGFAVSGFAASDTETIELPIPVELGKELRASYETLIESQPGYKPRTEHLHADGAPHYINRLIREDSPYLLQHAHNPINWFSWGDEALAMAKETNRPIFLSIGYATCHWCHVMEREVFEKLDVAGYLNDHFIPIKVDREQHPDVDATFMTAVQMMTGGGGWPLSAWLTPEAKPFYGGTYFPKDTFQDLQQRVVAAWSNSRSELEGEAEKVASALRDVNELAKAAKELGSSQVEQSIKLLLTEHDDLQGGFGNAPKFPREPGLMMLLQKAMYGGKQSEEAFEAAYFTLQRIAAGGIHDHVAGGFHRYAVDDDWLVPHFEKMLYNQAYLSRAYLRSYYLSGDWQHGRIATRTLDYVLREMTSPDGTFYSATDADSDGGEGKFFIWSESELDEILSAEDAKLAKRVWRTSDSGNFEGENILYMDGPFEEVAEELDIPVAQLLTRLDSIAEILLQHRQSRIPPVRDEKIIVGWNAMIITALTEAHSVLGRDDYLAAAEVAARVILESHWHNRDELQRIDFNGRQSIPANQSDYALLAESLIELFDATADRKWLTTAEALVARMTELFQDTDNGGYFMGADTVAGAKLPVRPKSIYDNSTPSGNSVALRVLTRLFQRTGNDDYSTRAEELLAAFAGQVERSPTGFGYMLTAAQEMFDGETGAVRYAGRGHVRVSIDRDKGSAGDLNVKFDVDDGWHINAHKPIQEYLIGTMVSDGAGEALNAVVYPEPVMRTLGFDRSELALYEGGFEITVPAGENAESLGLAKAAGAPSDFSAAMRSVQIELQACNDTTCLAPETVKISYSTAKLDPWEPAVALAD